MRSDSRLTLLDPKFSNTFFKISQISSLTGGQGWIELNLPDACYVADAHNVVTDTCQDVTLSGFLADQKLGKYNNEYGRIDIINMSRLLVLSLSQESDLTISNVSADRVLITLQKTSFVHYEFSFQPKKINHVVAQLHLNVPRNTTVMTENIRLNHNEMFTVKDLTLTVSIGFGPSNSSDAKFKTTSQPNSSTRFTLSTDYIKLKNVPVEIMTKGEVYRKYSKNNVIELEGDIAVEVVESNILVETNFPINSLVVDEDRVRLPVWYQHWPSVVVNLFWLMVGSCGTWVARSLWRRSACPNNRSQ